MAKLNRGSWRRLRQIAEILARHGLLWIVDGVGLSRYLGLAGRFRAQTLPTVDSSWPERVRLVLAELGPTYVKLGQLASMRPDILPDALAQSLQHLQDDVPPFSPQEAQRIIEHAWGQSLTEVLREFDPVPLAAASIGQVHCGWLGNGQAVVIKVRRPGILQRAESDFHILRVLAQRAEKRSPWAKRNGLVSLVEELVATMREELDFTVEAQNTDAARKNLAGQGDVVVPAVMWDLTHADVLVLESLGGVKINDREGLAAMGIQGDELARRFIHSLYRQIFQAGFFHADPHPGNVHVDSEGRLIFLDWGIVGVLSPSMRTRSIQIVLGLVQGQSEMVAEALAAIGSASGQVERRLLVRDIDRLRRRYYEAHLKAFNLGQALGDLFKTAQRHQLRIPAEFMLLAKTAVLADGVVRSLDPEFSLVEMGKPLAAELLWTRLNPQNWVPATVAEAMKLGGHLANIPEEFERALRTLSRGEIRIVLEHQNIDRVLAHWAVLANRVAFSFLLGAILLGLAWVVHGSELDRMAGMPIGEYAFLAVMALVLWVLIGAAGRHKS